MGLFGFRKRPLFSTIDSNDIAARYRRLRPIRLRLNNKLVGRLSRDVLDEGGRKLGILRRGVFVFDNEDETTVLMDYCIYDVYRKNRNAVEQYLCDCPPNPESDEMECLRAMQHATYALVVVVRVEPGVGCQIRNLFTEETRLLADVGFSKTARPGTLMATRLLDFGSFVATSGAALPVGILSDDELGEWQRKLQAGVNVDRFDPAPLIRGCLQRGASSRIRYETPNANPWSHGQGGYSPAEASAVSRSSPKRNSSKPAANRRCRCGSGKMFKNCCGKIKPNR